MTPTGWHRALAYALVGEQLPLEDVDTPDPDALRAALARAGWDVGRLAAHVNDVRRSGAPWPHPVPDALRAGLGAAQLHAALSRVRGDLGLDAVVLRPPSRRATLDADERRLLADVPPHHGA